ncbi:MAG: hypothetical protein ABJG68_13505 [Crocinitomicaceae bacterium]
MSTALANDYYLKALDYYPYNLQEFLENINYAMSYDEDHADSHCLMARFYMEQLCKFNDANYHFQKALTIDPHHLLTYYSYIIFCIKTKDIDRGLNLIERVRKIKGVVESTMFHREALLFETKEDFKKSKKLIYKAMMSCNCNDDIDFFKTELSRIQNKMNRFKKKKK